MKWYHFLFIAASLTGATGISFYFIYHGWYETQDVIVESNSMSDIYHYIKPNEYNKDLLVIFDIDNTIAKTPTGLGSDQWFYAKIENLMAQGKDQQEALKIVLPELFHIQFHSWLVPVEKNTVSIINDLQKKGVSVIALTARSLDLTYRTIEQLNKLGLTFTKTDPYECPLTHGHNHGKAGLYINGIIFSGEHSKGEMLVSWFNQIDYTPKKIIFIDDKLKNLQSVERSLHKRNYPFIGIRYGHEDKLIDQFTLESVADEEFAFFSEYPMENAVPTP